MQRVRRFQRPSLWTVLVPVVALVAGLLFATSSRTALGTDLRAGESSQLSSLIEQRDAAVARQQDELALLQRRVQALTDQAASRNGEVAAAQAEGEQGLTSAGLTELSGPGISVTLDDAPPLAGGGLPSGATADDLVIHQSDVQGVVNALWAAGAEAVSINGQRLGPTTAIRFAGEAVLVDFRPVTNPYEISAIGDPEAVSGAFLADQDVIDLAGLSDTLGFRFDFAEADELTLPAAGTPELHAARAGKAEPAAPQSSSPGSSASTPPPSDEPPGGAS
jgi:uncharacterized protein YlxW (UPF0749 family)